MTADVHRLTPDTEASRADKGSEVAVLGWLIDGSAPADEINEVWSLLEPTDFYQPVHEQIARVALRLFRAGEHVDVLRVLHEFVDHGLTRLLGDAGGGYLHSLLKYAATGIGNVRWHVSQVREAALLRRARLLHQQALQQLEQPGVDVLAHLQDQEGELLALKVEATASVDLGLTDFVAFMDEPDEPVDFVIPGLLARGEKAIFTGSEGLGKSTLMRQLVLCAASGLHPFTRDFIEPVRCLWLDAENPKPRNRRKMRPIWEACVRQGRPTQPGMLTLETLRGFSLQRDKDVAWLTRVVTEVQPDLIYLGPLYKVAGGPMDKEEVAVPVFDTLDRMLEMTDAALLMEAHAGHGKSSAGTRDWRPRGSAALLGWPDFGFGIGLSDDPSAEVNRLVDVHSWRGMREVDRLWPQQMAAGGAWPWDVW